MRFLWAYHYQRVTHKLMCAVERVIPDRTLDTLALRRIAYVTSSDCRLDKVIVPTITIDQIIESMKRAEGR